MLEEIKYWTKLIQDEIGSYADVDKAIESMNGIYEAGLLRTFKIKDTGIFAYVITNDFQGRLVLSEIVFYIKPEHRGSLRLVRRYITEIEKIAIANNCNCVKIGADIEFKDSTFIKLLKRWGYSDDTVSKQIKRG